MAFNHLDYNRSFLMVPGQNGATRYGVTIKPAVVARGQPYWRVIGIHHLLPEENMSNRNIYMDVLDENGNRIKNPIIWAGWTWEGIQGHERADPTPLDKPDNETAGNISVGSNQKVAVWIKGRSRASNDLSDRVEGLHTGWPDEVLPDGRKLNTWGHHSFYVVWQRTTANQLPPVEEPPVETPVPTPGHTYTISGPAFSILRADGLPIAQVTTPEWARRIVAALKVLDASEAQSTSDNKFREDLERWNRGEI